MITGHFTERLKKALNEPFDLNDTDKLTQELHNAELHLGYICSEEEDKLWSKLTDVIEANGGPL